MDNQSVTLIDTYDYETRLFFIQDDTGSRDFRDWWLEVGKLDFEAWRRVIEEE